MKPVKWLLLAGFALALSLQTAGSALAQPPANPPAGEVFYIPIPEDQALISMKRTSSDARAPVWTYVSIAVGTNNTFVYFDQWENGYDANIANPTDLYSTGNPDGTQVWGNGEADDGCPPNVNGTDPIACTDSNDVLSSGDVIVLANAVDPTTLQAVIDVDGGDKIGAAEQVAVSRVYWADDPSTLLAGAVEIYPVREWGLEYQSPVGEDNDYNNMFEHTSLAVQATLPNTQVYIDINGIASGGAQPPISLDEGDTVVFDDINEGTLVIADFPVQVQLLTGDRDSNYEYSDYTLLPKVDWGSVYYSPVGVTKPSDDIETQILLFNGDSSPIQVECRFREFERTVGVPSNGSAVLSVPNRSGAECASVSGSGGFFAISSVDAAGTQGGGGQTWDWGFTMLPQRLLAPQALVGLGLGRDPTSGSSPNQNGSPIYVSAVCAAPATSTYIYADLNGDSAPDDVDLNGDNDTTDTVDGIAESTTSDGMLINQLQSVRLFDPVSRNQTGMRITSRLGPNNTGDAGCDIMAVWGEDPNVASSGEPGFDVGTSIPPLRSFTGIKEAALEDNNSDGYVTPGDVLTYTIVAENTGISPIPTMTLTDTIPTGTSYVAGSTYFNDGTGWVAVPDNATGTPFPVDEAGVTRGPMPVDAIWSVRFNVVIEPLPPGECNLVINNTAFINGQGKDLDIVVYVLAQCTTVLVLEKAVRGDNPPPFDFTAVLAPDVFPVPAGVTLPVSGTIQPPSNGSLAVTYTVPTGIYSFTEALEPGWTLYEIACAGGAIADLENRTAIYNVVGDGFQKCTFYNEIPGKLIVNKVTRPADEPGEFPFIGGPLGIPGELTGTLNGGDSIAFDVRPGSYFAFEEVPQGWLLLHRRCDDPTGNSGAAPNPGEGEVPVPPGEVGAVVYNVGPGETVTCTWTDGLPSDLGDYVWADLNLNGIQDVVEPPFPNVSVELYRVDTPGAAQVADTLVATTTTDVFGLYFFARLAPGTYYVVMTPPPGFVITTPLQGSDPALDSDVDSNGRTANVFLPVGVAHLDLDGGLIPFGQLEVEKQTIPDGDATLFEFSGALTGTIADGQSLTRSVESGTYTVTEIVPDGWEFQSVSCTDPEAQISGSLATVFVPAGVTVKCTYTNRLLSQLGDLVWEDLNKDGIQDVGEPGLPGIVVELFRVDAPGEAAAVADTLIATDTTDAQGLYRFTALNPATYYVIVQKPNGFTVSPQNAGSNDGQDSDVNTAGRTANIVLPSSMTDLSWDAGMFLTPTSDDIPDEPGANKTFLPTVNK